MSHSNKVRWLAFTILLIGQLMIVLDVSVVNIALPTIQRDLNFSASTLAWVVNAYLITFGGFMLLSGRLGDLWGHKKVFMLGMTVFTGASLFCGLSQSGSWLIAGRFVQGFGGALVSSVVLGILYKLFSDKEDQIRSLGYYGLVSAAGASVGLIIGGLLTEILSWHWIFYINVPFGLVAIIAGAYLIPRDDGIGFGQGIDVTGAILLVISLVLVNYSIIEASSRGLIAFQTAGCFVSAVVLLVLLVFVESRSRAPLISGKIFKVRNLTAANVTQFFISWAIFSPFFLTALFLQEIYLLNPAWTGLAFAPQMVTYGFAGIYLAPKIIRRFGPKHTVLMGIPLFFISMILFAYMPLHFSYWLRVLPAMLIFGTGGTLSSIPLSHLAMSEVKKEDTGLASGLINTSRQVGGAVGIAVCGSVAAAYATSLLLKGAPQYAALASSYHLGFLISAAILIIPFIAALRLKTAEQSESNDLFEEKIDRSIGVGEI